MTKPTPLNYAPASRLRWRRWIVPLSIFIASIAVLITVSLLQLQLSLRSRNEPSELRCAASLSTIYRAMILYADASNGAAPADFVTLLEMQDISPD